MKKTRKQTIKTKILIPLLLVSLAILFCVGTACAGSNNTTIQSDNLTVSDTQTTSNSNNSTTNTSLGSETNQTLSDPVIYNGGVPVSRGGQPAGYNWGTIQNAIDNAQDGDTIMLENGATFYEHDLNISKNLDFDVLGGGHATIDALGLGRIFIINGGVTVHLYNLTLQNGKYNGGDMFCGGAIINSGTLTITNCTFTNNTASVTDFACQGGAIWNDGTLTVIDSTFTKNTANAAGFGGAIYNSGTLLVNNSIFQDNYNTWSLWMFGVKIGGSGGAIYNSGTLKVIGSTFTHNYGDYGVGGAICNEGGNLTITGSTFTSNKVYFGKGGAIYNSGFLNVTGSTFTSNGGSGTDEHPVRGGAIYNEGTLIATSTTFFNNYVYGSGGAIWNSGTLNVTSNTFTENTASGLGGAIYNTGGDVTSRIVKFNRIVGNDEIYSVGGTLDATLNWWGSNSSPAEKIRGSVHFDPWIILTVSANPTTIDNGGTSILEADLLHDSSYNPTNPNASYHNPALGHVPDIAVTLTIPWGSFTYSGTTNSVTLNTINGAITPVTFYANKGAINPLFNPVRVNATADGYTTNETESAYIYINPVANLTVTETDTPDPVIAGNQLTYTITITNSGPDPAEDVTLDDNVPLQSGTLQYRYKTNDDDWSSWTSFTNLLHLDLGTILNGKNATIEIQGIINASIAQGSVIINMVTVNTTTTPGDKTASIQTTVNTQADLNVTKTGPTTIIAGTQITYTITVTNNGPSDAQNVVIMDNIPTILQNVSHDSFNLGTILAGTSKTITINGTIPSNTTKGTTIQNNATVTSTTSGTTTPSLLVTTTVDTLADVDLNKTVNNTRPDVGDTVTFIVTAHNYGPSDATNIQIQDIMPSDFTNVTITPSQGTYDDETGIWALDLISGEEATLNLTGIVSTIMAGENTTNNATKISQTQEDSDTLDTANATIYVPKADLYIQITSNKNNPTVGEKFTLTYKLGNSGPDDADNVTIIIPVPEGFHILNIYGDGNWTVNSNGTITWTFTNVTVGDPYLHLYGYASGAEDIRFTASIFSDTYNANTIGVNTLSIQVLPEETSQVNAATTVRMQNTGMPLAGMVLAILMMLGGFISTRKKQ